MKTSSIITQLDLTIPRLYDCLSYAPCYHIYPNLLKEQKYKMLCRKMIENDPVFHFYKDSLFLWLREKAFLQRNRQNIPFFEMDFDDFYVCFYPTQKYYILIFQ